jgi:glycosyltransferase involved in cell wall biosynthesis
MLHLGPSFWSDGTVEAEERVTDDRLATLYSRCRYVSGLRRGEGFELPVIEGLACGARPVCFDVPCYRDWFDGHAIFVHEVSPEQLVPELVEVFRREPAPVTPEERDAVLARFDWSRICSRFWQLVLEPEAGR